MPPQPAEQKAPAGTCRSLLACKPVTLLLLSAEQSSKETRSRRRLGVWLRLVRWRWLLGRFGAASGCCLEHPHGCAQILKIVLQGTHLGTQMINFTLLTE